MSETAGSGTRMPAEWEPHAATWLAYPHLGSDWPGKLSAVRWAFAEFARILASREAVRLLVRNAQEAERARSVLRRSGAELQRIDLQALPTDRSWLRDSGPTFALRGGRLQAVCWSFNAWGRYPNWQADRKVGRHIAIAAGAGIVEPKAHGRAVVMEGGAIDSNGRGTVLTTEQCLLGGGRRARNPGLSRDGIEQVLHDSLGATNVLWLGRGIAGDDTSGHVDTLARFVGRSRIAAVVETNGRDENYAALQDNLRRLRGMCDERGRPIEIVELPMPRPLWFDGYRLPASYANFYIANGAVLVPTFNDANDAPALRVLGECFPGRDVHGVHCTDIALGLGALHCLAQQQPSAGTPRQAQAEGIPALAGR